MCNIQAANLKLYPCRNEYEQICMPWLENRYAEWEPCKHEFCSRKEITVILRCVIPVVLSNNKNKLNGTYVYRNKHNYIPSSTFTITKVQLHVSAINVGHLQVAHEELINKLYQHVWGVYSLWGGVGARSHFVLEKRVWTGVVLGIVLKYHSCLLTAMSISGLHFLYVQCILEKLYYLCTKSKVLLYCIHSFTYLGLIVYYLYC